MTIREIMLQDLELIDTIQRASYPEALHEDQELFRRILSQPNAICLIKQEANDIAGYIFGYPSNENRINFEHGPEPLSTEVKSLYLHDLCIHPAHQGKGLAKDLFNVFKKTAQKRSFERIMAIAIENALPFWQRQGFQTLSLNPYHGETAYMIRQDLKEDDL